MANARYSIDTVPNECQIRVQLQKTMHMKENAPVVISYRIFTCAVHCDTNLVLANDVK